MRRVHEKSVHKEVSKGDERDGRKKIFDGCKGTVSWGKSKRV